MYAFYLQSGLDLLLIAPCACHEGPYFFLVFFISIHLGKEKKEKRSEVREEKYETRVAALNKKIKKCEPYLLYFI